MLVSYFGLQTQISSRKRTFVAIDRKERKKGTLTHRYRHGLLHTLDPKEGLKEQDRARNHLVLLEQVRLKVPAVERPDELGALRVGDGRREAVGGESEWLRSE